MLIHGSFRVGIHRERKRENKNSFKIALGKGRRISYSAAGSSRPEWQPGEPFS